ncbi:MAG: hypothetical protein ACOX4P_02950 [Anaerovoracaceae bacterium]|jgi:hypothetical protein
MDFNQKKMMDLAEQLGLGERNEPGVKKAADTASQYANKNEDELLSEILALKRNLKSNPAEFRKQLAAVKALRGMMNREQKERLDKVIALLEQE